MSVNRPCAKPSQWFALGSGVKALDARAHRENFPQHHHDSFQITVATRGVFKNQIAGQLYVTDVDAISVTQPNEVHATVCDAVLGHWFFTLYVPADLFQAHWSQVGPINLKTVITDAGLVNAVHQMRCQLVADATVSESEITDLIQGLLPHQSTQTSPSRVDWRDFVASLNLTTCPDTTVKDFAEKNGMSQYQLIRLFQGQVGMTPHQFILNQKTDQVKTLIENGWSLTDAALEAGFYDAPHMCQVFKRFTGSTPQAFQRAIISKT